MYGVLITLSPKRLVQLEEDPETLEEVLEARHETPIPGLLDLGKTWDALDVMLSERGKDAVLGDAVLGRSGRALHAGAGEHAYGSARVLAPARVAEISAKLDALAATHVKDRYSALATAKVHGKFGEQPDDEERDGLEIVLRRLVALYKDAAKQKHSMLLVVT
jgi:hypothetical protein